MLASQSEGTTKSARLESPAIRTIISEFFDTCSPDQAAALAPTLAMVAWMIFDRLSGVKGFTA